MSTILVVDDMPIFRDPIAASLRLAGFETACAANGRDALAAARAKRPGVILLDIAMPVMDGIACLRALRADPALSDVPVILLTAMSDKRYVIEAAKLGVQDYLLKSAFSMKELLTRVCRYVQPTGKPGAGKREGAPATESAAKGKAADVTATGSPAPSPSQTPAPAQPPVAAQAPAPAPESHAPATGGAATFTRLLTREQCLARAEKALAAKTLSGAVADVIRLAASPRSNVGDLAPLIARDPMLSARVLQAANSAAYVSSRGVVSNIPDAVRQVGTSAVRQIAAALGVFEAMPPSELDGFNPVRCWQHSFAVAMLCERLALCPKEGAGPKDAGQGSPGAAAPGVAYLVGLCHDLGEILFHTHFGKEYAQVLEVQARTANAADDVERQMLGMSKGELVQTIIKCLGLPDAIKEPIGSFHTTAGGAGGGAAGGAGPGASGLLRVLRLAELYANGLLLASSNKAPVAPLTKAECKAAVGRDEPPAPDVTVFRSEVLYTTGVLARLSSQEAEELMKPQFDKTTARLWVAREPSLSAFDPVTAALEAMGQVTVKDRLPEAADAAAGIDGLAVLAPSDLSAGFTGAEVSKALAAAAAGSGSGRPVPVLWLVARANFSAPANPPKGRPAAPAATRWPVSLERVAAFVKSCATKGATAAAAA